MTNADLTEMEWLAAVLRTTAERLERATALLRAAGDLERLQARLVAIAADRRPPPAVAARAAEAAAVVAEGERPSGRAVDSLPIRVGASRTVAVFDHDTEKRVKVAKITAGASRPPF